MRPATSILRPHRGSRLFLGLGLLFALSIPAAVTRAQPTTIPRFDFSFSNPGARSLGFGGAFAALADDATAAYTNPAGLVQLTQPEVSLELRLWNRSPRFLSGGRIEGEPTGIGIDTVSGLTLGRDSSEDFQPAFASVVLPKGRWSFALYAHQLALFEQAAESQGFFFEEDPFLGNRFPATLEGVELDVLTLGFAAAWRVSDRLSLGIGAVFSDTFLGTTSGAFLADSPEEAFDRVTFRPERRLSTNTLDLDGTDLTFNAGLLWRLSDQVSGAIFYRQGAEASGISTFELGPAIPGDGIFSNPAVFNVPDVAGLGLAYRSKSGRFTLTTELDWVGYEGLILIDDTELRSDVGREYRDAWEIHGGAEYALVRTDRILALRAGAWVERNGEDFDGDEVTHYTAGLGFVARGIQVDLAADLSEEVDTFSVSMIYTF